MTRHGPRCILGWLVLCSLACAAETPKSTPPPDLPDAAPADAGTGAVPGTPTLGCRTASDCSASDGRAVDCVAITSDFRACAIAPPAPATAATNERDECGPERPCAAGECYSLSVAATNQCAPGGFDVYNVCVRDECTSDAECAGGGFCTPSGVAGTRQIASYPARHCVPAACRQSADCTAKPGGVCALLREGCSPLGSEPWGFSGAQLACVYPDGCTESSDCPGSHSCSMVDGAAVCL